MRSMRLSEGLDEKYEVEWRVRWEVWGWVKDQISLRCYTSYMRSIKLSVGRDELIKIESKIIW